LRLVCRFADRENRLPCRLRSFVMMVEIFKRFHFEAAHRLPNYPQVHGHSYTVELWCKGPATDGYVLPEQAMTDAAQRIRERLDHQLLNDVLDTPTSENIARFIWRELAEQLPLSQVWVYRDTLGFGAVCRGP
jgi:6-pyruvoyltetrahydropterin/6-carboxytetrahydropterin synthase